MGTMEQIEREIQLLGITKRYRGYRQTAFSVELVLENEDCLYNVTEQIYQVVARRCSCGSSCIERNIRTASHTAWRMNLPRLRLIAGYPISAPPSASEFISILATYIQRTSCLPFSFLPAGRLWLPASCRASFFTPSFFDFLLDFLFADFP